MVLAWVKQECQKIRMAQLMPNDSHRLEQIEAFQETFQLCQLSVLGGVGECFQ